MARFNLDDYVAVQERIVRFWSEYPDGRIDTQLMTNPMELEEVVFRTAVYKHRDDLNPSATGWAQERAGGSGANQTSWVENGETSSIGRALANLGYATSQKDRPSREEMTKAQPQQPAQPSEPELTWHDFWDWARSQGIGSKQLVEDMLGPGVREMAPAAVKVALKAHLDELAAAQGDLPDELNPEGI